MHFRYLVVVCCLSFFSAGIGAEEPLKISHGPMLGAVSESTAAIWVRTSIPGDITIALSGTAPSLPPQRRKLKTVAASDNTCIARFDELKPGGQYQYVVSAGKSTFTGTIKTLSPALKGETIRIVYGYGHNPKNDKMPAGTSVFTKMLQRKAHTVLFLGDFPYTMVGKRKEVYHGNKELRSIVDFRKLTSSTPTYGIYDDHDFGPNDCDGTHKYAKEALVAFKEYWPNPSYGLPDNKGIYCSFVVGNVEFFLLDGRYQSRRSKKTMLGKVQFDWLCDGLKKSRSRYKVLVSGTQFGRVKRDGWAGPYYIKERNRLFSFILKNKISGVIGISGDVHRSDIYKLPLGENRFFYDFTPGALSRKQRATLDPLPSGVIHSYGVQDDNNMFGEIEFNPSSDSKVALRFRSFSAKNGLIHEHTLSPADLLLQ